MKDKTLVIVESPSKAKTIGKILGTRYRVVASVGHVRDLPKSKLGIDIEDDFQPQYISIRGKGDIIKMLKKEAKSASKVYLATDPDREGEAISWHIAYLLGMDVTQPCRIEFHEITKTAVKNAVKNPRCIDLNLVDAQQARRVLDRLVGYQISPLLWRKIRRGLSAGRVQSAALKILCDREKEIQNFVPEEYWTVTGTFEKGRKKFKAELSKFKGKKVSIASEKESEKVLADLKSGSYTVSKVEEKERTKKPMPPFTTSSLQQEASNKLNYNTRRTMLIAQQLYEGVDIKGQGTMGLVTYIRTDSVRISQEAKNAAESMIVNDYGAEYLGTNVYTNKKRDVQDAHEAIRPSNPLLKPDMVKDSLTKEQYNLYNLIWCRFTASQMSQAVFDSVGADIVCGDYTFRATGSKIRFDGYLRVYDNKSDEDKNSLIPPLEPGEALKEPELNGEQHFTQPPARYTEASLVKELEEKNIGRPSTYAPIVGTLTERKYVAREKKKLVPRELGLLVNDLMSEYFKKIVDAGFTASMEDRLDDVEIKGIDWKSVIRDFYGDFEKDLKRADEAIEKVVIEDEPTGEMCPACGRPLVKKHGRFGEFIACSGYPECKTTMTITKKIGVKCPECGKELLERKSRRGKLFYGCEGYPDCKQVYWDRPVDKKCPTCGSLLVEKRKKNQLVLKCSDPECSYSETVNSEQE